MAITPINNLEHISNINKITDTVNDKSSAQNSDFRNIFNQLVDNVQKSEDELAKEQYLFTTGQSQDTYSLGIAATKAQISVDMLIAIRNKALDSYNELMRLSL